MGSISTILAVALGGAVGAVARHFTMSAVEIWGGAAFPFGTLLVNVLGSFVLGALVALGGLAWSPSEEVKTFLVVGLLGSFTTFSAFSLDTVALFERGNYALCGIYIGVSVVLSIVGLIAGLQLVRWSMG